MKQFLFSVCLLLVSGLLARAEIVLSPGTYASNKNTNTTDNSVGFTFTTTQSAAPSQRWQLKEMVFGLGTNNVNMKLTQASAYLFKLNGSTWDFVGGGASQSKSYDQNITSDGANNTVTFNFNQDSVFGIAGDQGSGLLANTTYMLGINVTTSNNGNVWWGASANASSGTWGSSQSNLPLSTSTWDSQNYPDSFPNIVGWGGGDNFRVSLDASAVPEPGTLILGSIAAMAGGGGVFWRRRRKKAAEAAEAVTATQVAAE